MRIQRYSKNLHIYLPIFAAICIFVFYSNSITDIRYQPKTQRTQSHPIASSTVLVTRVIDGDTFEISTGEHVRYIGIDTPELANSKGEEECFAQQAKKYNERLILHQEVTLFTDKSDKDRYGRLLRYVYVGNLFINDQLVREGFAFAKSYPPNVSRQHGLNQAQLSAKQSSKGVWSECVKVQTP
jgi:micrococcal nuclease